MPKRPRPGSLGVDGSRASRPPRRHLYLIFDDWLWGYSIRRADFPADGDEADAEPALWNWKMKDTVAIDRTEHPPPRAILQLGAPRGNDWAAASCFAAAFDTMIMAMHAESPYEVDDDDTELPVPEDLVPIFDVRSRAIIFGPRPEAYPANPVYISAWNKVFALSACSFEVLDQSPLPKRGGSNCSWRELPGPPFASRYVVAYAVHPDGRRIFFTVVEVLKARTFCFRMAEGMVGGNSGWECHGDWVLPFYGRGHFDRELDAWVGLARYPNIGHLCACYLEFVEGGPCGGDDGQRGMSRKDSKENLFTEEPDERPVSVGPLLYMGGGSRYCLVQCISKEADTRYLSRVTAFSLKYDRNGDLTTGHSRQVRYYRVPEGATQSMLKTPVAFWM